MHACMPACMHSAARDAYLPVCCLRAGKERASDEDRGLDGRLAGVCSVIPPWRAVRGCVAMARRPWVCCPPGCVKNTASFVLFFGGQATESTSSACTCTTRSTPSPSKRSTKSRASPSRSSAACTRSTCVLVFAVVLCLLRCCVCVQLGGIHGKLFTHPPIAPPPHIHRHPESLPPVEVCVIRVIPPRACLRDVSA